MLVQDLLVGHPGQFRSKRTAHGGSLAVAVFDRGHLPSRVMRTWSSVAGWGLRGRGIQILPRFAGAELRLIRAIEFIQRAVDHIPESGRCVTAIDRDLVATTTVDLFALYLPDDVMPCCR